MTIKALIADITAVTTDFGTASVTAAKLGACAVETAKIKLLNVTIAKIANSAVTNAKITSSNVGGWVTGTFCATDTSVAFTIAVTSAATIVRATVIITAAGSNGCTFDLEDSGALCILNARTISAAICHTGPWTSVEQTLVLAAGNELRGIITPGAAKTTAEGTYYIQYILS